MTSAFFLVSNPAAGVAKKTGFFASHLPGKGYSIFSGRSGTSILNPPKLQVAKLLVGVPKRGDSFLHSAPTHKAQVHPQKW